VMQVSYQLAGAAHVVRLAAAAGELEHAALGPVVADELLRGLDRLGRVALLFADRCVAGLAWQRDRVAKNLEGSLQAAVESVEVVGYDVALKFPSEALPHASGRGG